MRGESFCDANESLTRFLNLYCNQKASPGYAVMLSGPWGSGKTWFIEHFQEALRNKGKPTLYVSLFGVSKAADIRDQFFAQIHPKLADPRVQKAWGLAKSFLKGSLKLDLYGDEKDDATLQIAIPDIEKWASTEGAVLIFDDLERCGMSLNDSLGFINQFVEHDGYRVIILANEDAESLSQSSGFPTIKEKTIGRTFRIQPDAESALKHFLTEVDSPMARQLIEPRQNMALNIFRRAEYKNLRQLRQAIFDFSTLLTCLQIKDADTKKETFVDRLLEDVLTISIEHRAGLLTSQDIRKLGEIDWLRYIGRNKNDDEEPTESAKDRALKRHGYNDSVTLALPASAYADFYENGSLSELSSADALRNSRHLADQQTPSWRRLWYLFDIENKEFDALYRDVYRKLTFLEYSDEGELLHVASMLLNLASIGLIDRTTTQIENTVRKVVLQLAKKDLIDVDGRRARHDSPMRHMSAYGLGFSAPESNAFREFCAFYLLQKDAARKRRVQQRIKLWMGMLPNDLETWARHLCRSTDENSWFDEDPVFPYVSANKFARFLLAAEAPTIIRIRDAFEERFSYPYQHCPWKVRELPFLKDLYQCVAAKWDAQNQRRLPVSRYCLQNRFIPTLKKSIESLEKFQSENDKAVL